MMKCSLQAKRCGGCTRLSVPYEKQLTFKQNKVRALFGKAAPIVGMKEPYHYRNKVISAFAFDKQGLISGMYAYGTHYVLPTDECLLENERASEIVAIVRDILSKLGVHAYDEKRKNGVLRFVQVRYAKKTKQALLTVVTNQPNMPHLRTFVQQVTERCPDVVSIVHNQNERAGSAVLGFQEVVIYGNGTIQDVLCGKKFNIASRSFYQVNSLQTERLYDAAIGMAKLTKEDTILDAYCGIGTIGIIASKYAKKVIGIEINSAAVKLAKQNAILNGVKNITFRQGDAGKELIKMEEHMDVVILDPPRSGSDKAFMQAIIDRKPKKVVYISCDINTQHRDIQPLLKAGYTIQNVKPVDMFPHTEHIECVVLLTKG